MNRSINVKSDTSCTGQTERLQESSTSTWMRELMWNQTDHAQVKQKGCSKLGVKCCSVTEISAFSRLLHSNLALLCQHSILMVTAFLLSGAKCISSWTQYKSIFVFYQLNHCSQTRSLLCKQDTPLFGCPCSHALLKPCELCVLLIVVGLLGYCSLLWAS